MIVRYNFVKSTFKIQKSGVPENCFISGKHIYPCEAMHHVSKVLYILKELDQRLKADYEHYVLRYIKAYDKVLDILNNYQDDQELSKEDFKKIKKALKISWMHDFDVRSLEIGRMTLKDFRAQVNKWRDHEVNEPTWKQPHYIEDFRKANQNKGYDTAEFLISLGFVVIEDGYLVYSSDIRPSISLDMLDLYSEREDGSWLLKPKSIEMLRKERNQKINQLRRSTWATTKDIFHCPSGFTRMGYLNWRKECKEVGLNPDELRRSSRYY